jgi:hypothetical protein
VPDEFHHTVWSSRLPPNIQAILAGQPESSLDSAARFADRIPEVAPQPALASVGRPLTGPHFCRGSRISPARWQHSSSEQDRLHCSFRDTGLISRDPCYCSRTPCSSCSYTLPILWNRRPGNRIPSVGNTEPTPASIIAATEPGRKSLLSPAPTDGRGNKRCRHHRRHMSALQ